MTVVLVDRFHMNLGLNINDINDNNISENEECDHQHFKVIKTQVTEIEVNQMARYDKDVEKIKILSVNAIKTCFDCSSRLITEDDLKREIKEHWTSPPSDLVKIKKLWLSCPCKKTHPKNGGSQDLICSQCQKVNIFFHEMDAEFNDHEITLDPCYRENSEGGL